MSTFYFYADPGLTTPIAGALDFAQAVDGSTGPVQQTVYFGSAASGHVLRAASNPGSDPIVISIVDSALGSGSPATDVKLALEPTFSGRNGGDPLSLGPTIMSGVGNAVAIYIRVLDTTGAIGVHTDLSLVTNQWEET